MNYVYSYKVFFFYIWIEKRNLIWGLFLEDNIYSDVLRNKIGIIGLFWGFLVILDLV